MAPDTAHEKASPLAQEVIRELFTDEDRAKFHELGYRRLVEGAVRAPRLQVQMFLGFAATASEHYGQGDGELVRKSLDAAGTLVSDIIEADGGPMADDLSYVNSYIKVAESAHELGQGRDYVRTVLDMAVTKVTEPSEHPDPAAQADALLTLGQVAHSTGQDFEYLEGLVESARGLHAAANKGLNDETTVDARLDQLRAILGLAQWAYPSDGKELREIIDDARKRWQPEGDDVPAHTLDAKVGELSKIALIALKAGHGQPYIRSILEEGLDYANRGADTSAYLELARTAHVTMPNWTDEEKFTGDILLDGYRAIVGRDEPKPLRETLRDYNELMHGLFRPPSRLKAVLQGQFAIGGLKAIEAGGGTPREQHMLLNTLLRDVNLSEDFMRTSGLQHKPLSYVFAPGRKPVTGRSQEPVVS